MLLKNVRLPGSAETTTDMLLREGRIAAIGPGLRVDAPELDLRGRLASAGFVETHVHLDKSCILDRCAPARDIAGAVSAVSELKRTFTVEDVRARARRTLEKSVLNGTTHMRTHVEVDPVIGLRGVEGVLALVREWDWAIDLELCVFPQEGLTNNPGTEALMREALMRGCRVVGAAPYTDTNPRAQIDIVFELAREFDVDIDMHLDFGADPTCMDLEYVCDSTLRYGYGGRVTIGHVTKLSAVEPAAFTHAARRLADAGVALTVLPATDLYLIGRHMPHSVMRGVVPCHRLLEHGVNCSLSTNNVLNPFTPFGDCSLIRMANLYANVAQIGTPEELQACYDMISGRAARILRLDGHGVKAGDAADLVVLNCETVPQAIAELAEPLYGFKRGRMTFSREPARLHRPD